MGKGGEGEGAGSPEKAGRKPDVVCMNNPNRKIFTHEQEEGGSAT